MGKINKIDRTVLSSDIKSDLDSKATKTELLNTKSDLENQINNVVSNLVRKPSVSTFSSIATTYPNPLEGWTVSVDDTNITYQYDEDTSTWIKTSINAIPKATSLLDGLLTKEDKAKIDTVQSNAEPNKSTAQILTDIKTVDGSGSGLDADLLDGQHGSYYSPSTHDHDGRYYTQSQINTSLAGKQNNLGFTPENSVNKNVANGYAGLDANGKLVSTQIPSEYVTSSQLGSAGYGDMMKSAYDTNGNGIVDVAEVSNSVDWTNVQSKPTTLGGYGITDALPATGNAVSASKLVTARTIATSGDATGTATSFNGTANITIPLTLATTGVTSGTYKSVTVDNKGRVTAGTNPTTLAGYGIADAATSTHNHDTTYIKGVTSTTAPSSPATNLIWIDLN